MPCRITPYQKEQWRLRQKQLEEQQREKQRVAQLRNQWAQFTAARQYDLLAAHQRATYHEKAQKLIELDRLINGE